MSTPPILPDTQAGPEKSHAMLRCAALAVAGLLLALLAVWIGSGLLDGFDYRGTNRLGRRFLRHLPWMLPLAAICGVLIGSYFRWAIEQRRKGLVLTFAVVRIFALFPLLGFAMLGALMFAFLAAIPLGIYRRLLSGKPAEGDREVLMNRVIVTPLWVMTLPFTLLKVESQGDVPIPAWVAPSRLLDWLPVLFIMLFAGPGFESEATGERVDPNWLAALAAYWLADWLIVTGYVSPLVAERTAAERLAALSHSNPPL